MDCIYLYYDLVIQCTRLLEPKAGFSMIIQTIGNCLPVYMM